MLTTLLLLISPITIETLALAEAPQAKVLFANEKFYQNQKGKEESFVGTLKMVKRPGGVIGFGRFNPYYLIMKNDKREVYVGGKKDALTPFVDKTVKIVGKKVDLEVEGRNHREIWPASIALVAKAKEEGGKEGSLKPIGRAYWRANSRPGTKPQQMVIRSDAELKKNLQAFNQEAQIKFLAKQFKVDTIDLDKHVIIVATAGAKPTGGYRLEIVDLVPKGKMLTVKWKLHSPKPGTIVTQAFTHPAQAVLIPRFDGKIVFEQSK